MNPKWGDQISSRNIGAVLHFQWHGHGLRLRRLSHDPMADQLPITATKDVCYRFIGILSERWKGIRPCGPLYVAKGPTENQTSLVVVGLCFEETASWPMPLQLRCGAWLSAQSWLLQRQDSAYDFSFPHVIMSEEVFWTGLKPRAIGQKVESSNSRPALASALRLPLDVAPACKLTRGFRRVSTSAPELRSGKSLA